MKKETSVTGKIIFNTMSTGPAPGQKLSEWAIKESQNLLELEQYLNNKVAVDVFKKFGIGIRVHLNAE